MRVRVYKDQEAIVGTSHPAWGKGCTCVRVCVLGVGGDNKCEGRETLMHGARLTAHVNTLSQPGGAILKWESTIVIYTIVCNARRSSVGQGEL